MIEELWQGFLDWSWSPIVTAAACGYAMYYLCKVVHQPKLFVKAGQYEEKLKKNLKVLDEYYWPTFWCFTSHLQTIFRVILKSKPFLPYRREYLDTPDDGCIALDWIDNNENNTTHPDPLTRPTVLVLPGITGCSDASYARHVVVEASKMGYRTLVFNNRGLGKDVKLKTPRTFCACNAEDLEHVLDHIKTNLPESPLFIFAVSLGGVLLTNYLSRFGKPGANLVAAMTVSSPMDSYGTTESLERPLNWCLYNRHLVNKLKALIKMINLTNYLTRVGKPDANLKAALCVSVAMDSFKSTASLEQPVNWLFYNRHLANKLKNLVKTNWHVFQEKIAELPYKLEDVMGARTIREFDEHFTSKCFGFESVDHYYEESSIVLKPLENIQVPMVFLNSVDDPFAPGETLPIESITKNPKLAVILTEYGGHIGFVEGMFIRGRSFVERLFFQYASCMLNENNNTRKTKLS